MNQLLIFNIQFISVIVFSVLVVKWYLNSFKTLTLRATLLPLVSLHIIRTVGLIYLIPGMLGIDPSLPKDFLYPTAYGDLLAAILAAVAVFLLLNKNKGAYAWVWIFNIVGFLDLVIAMINGIRFQFLTYNVGLAWFLPAFIVPALLVSHITIFYLLVKHSSSET